jgi:hypothetical protein
MTTIKQTTFAWAVIVNGVTVCICHTKEQAEKVAAAGAAK